MDIKEAKPEDWEIIQSLNNELFLSDKQFDKDLNIKWPYTQEGIEYFKALSNKLHNNYCYLAQVDNNPVGYISMHIKDFGQYREGKYLEIDNIIVKEKYRSLGIGDNLVNKAKELGKSLNCTKLYVSSYFNNTNGIRFYKREGFENIKTELELEI